MFMALHFHNRRSHFSSYQVITFCAGKVLRKEKNVEKVGGRLVDCSLCRFCFQEEFFFKCMVIMQHLACGICCAVLLPVLGDEIQRSMCTLQNGDKMHIAAFRCCIFLYLRAGKC